FPRHCPANQAGPNCVIAKKGSGALDRIPKRFRGIVVAKETIARLGRLKRRIVVLDDFLNPAAGIRDRECAVSQAIHCDKPAGLEPRRYQRDIGTCFDQVSQPFIEMTAISESLWIAAGTDAESGLKRCITLSQNN